MFDFNQWQSENEKHLARSLEWLRHRLRKVEATSETLARDKLDGGVFADYPSVEGQYQPALEVVASRFGLSPFEQQVLLLCAAMEFDTAVPEMLARAQGDPSRPFPTYAVCFAILDDPAWDVLSPERPLRRFRLIEIDRHPLTPLTSSPLRASDRIVSFLKGLNHLDERLALLLQQVDSSGSLPESQQQLVDEAITTITRNETQIPCIQLLGSDHETKQQIASQICLSLNAQLYRISADLIPTAVDQLDELAKLWERECHLVPSALYVDASEHHDSQTLVNVKRFVARISGVVFCDLFDRGKLGSRELVLDVAMPRAEEQKEAWEERLPGLPESTAKVLTGQFDLNLGSIERIADKLMEETNASELGQNGDESVIYDQRRIRELCRHESRPRLDDLAQRVDVRATWDDIVLPAEELSLLTQVAAQVCHRGKVLDDWGFRDKANRGLGVTALFSGESGTGKTMAAEVIASELQLDLYRIDLSAVINKYIGETEKRLRKLFDAAECGGAILFFDEADALFGKRSEVKDSHDRFANIEVNYLLQRMESYRGLAILATNNKRSLDTAFLRRLRFIVEFRFPELKQRKEIWQRIFPTRTPLSGIDYNHLAKLRLTGGNIHNIALNAAYTAASSRPAIDMPCILNAAKSELVKTQKPYNVGDFQWNGRQEVGA